MSRHIFTLAYIPGHCLDLGLALARALSGVYRIMTRAKVNKFQISRECYMLAAKHIFPAVRDNDSQTCTGELNGSFKN